MSITYREGDGFLSRTGNNWTLHLPDGVNEGEQGLTVKVTDVATGQVVRTESYTALVADRENAIVSLPASLDPVITPLPPPPPTPLPTELTAALATNVGSIAENSASPIVFSVTLSEVSSVETRIVYRLRGQAVIGIHYSPPESYLTNAGYGEIFIPAGELVANISVQLIDDDEYTGNRVIEFQRSSITNNGASVPVTTAYSVTVEIVEDEPVPPVLEPIPPDLACSFVTLTPAQQLETSTNPFILTVGINAASTVDTTVDVSFTRWTSDAVLGTNFTSNWAHTTSNFADIVTVIIPPGQTTQGILLTPIRVPFAQGNKNIRATVVGAKNNTKSIPVLDTEEKQAIIQDSDFRVTMIGNNPWTGNEGNIVTHPRQYTQVPSTFVLQSSNAVPGTMEVEIFLGGTAVLGVDYIVSPNIFTQDFSTGYNYRGTHYFTASYQGSPGATTLRFYSLNPASPKYVTFNMNRVTNFVAENSGYVADNANTLSGGYNAYYMVDFT